MHLYHATRAYLRFKICIKLAPQAVHAVPSGEVIGRINIEPADFGFPAPPGQGLEICSQERRDPASPTDRNSHKKVRVGK